MSTGCSSPGGTFVFSTLNKDNPLFGAHPGTAERHQLGSRAPSCPPPAGSGPARSGQSGGAPADDASWLRAVRNWRRLRGEIRDEGEWGMAPFAAHEFGLVTHFITVGGAVDELDRHGFDVAAVFPCDRAVPLEPGGTLDAMYMHLVAHRRP